MTAGSEAATERAYIGPLDILKSKAKTAIYNGFRDKFSELNQEIQTELKQYSQRVNQFLCSNDLNLNRWAAQLQRKIENSKSDWTHLRARIVPYFYQSRDRKYLDHLELDLKNNAETFKRINKIFTDHFPIHSKL